MNILENGVWCWRTSLLASGLHQEATVSGPDTEMVFQPKQLNRYNKVSSKITLINAGIVFLISVNAKFFKFINVKNTTTFRNQSEVICHSQSK